MLKDRVTLVLFVLISAMTLAAIANSFFVFYYQKNYKFTVEAPCDPSQQNCFVRNCGKEDECPPNNLERYRIFALRASDFEGCPNNSCLIECITGQVRCEEILCDESRGDACTAVATAE